MFSAAPAAAAAEVKAEAVKAAASEVEDDDPFADIIKIFDNK